MSNRKSIDFEITEMSEPSEEALAWALDRLGPFVVRQGDIHALRGRSIRISVDADADENSDDTLVTLEVV